MELLMQTSKLENAGGYSQNVQEYMVKESGAADYSSAIVLLRNLGERRDMTSLEREALSAAVRLLKQNMGEREK